MVGNIINHLEGLRNVLLPKRYNKSKLSLYNTTEVLDAGARRDADFFKTIKTTAKIAPNMYQIEIDGSRHIKLLTRSKL